jgi:hypothetical protein
MPTNGDAQIDDAENGDGNGSDVEPIEATAS